MDGETLRAVKTHMMNDFIELLPPNMPENLKALNTTMARATLELSRIMLDALGEDTNPFEWWPSQSNLSALFPLAKMLFSIPASTSDSALRMSERLVPQGLRSISFGLGWTWIISVESIEFDNIYMVAGTDLHHQDGRKLREERDLSLINRLGVLINQARGDDEVQ